MAGAGLGPVPGPPHHHHSSAGLRCPRAAAHSGLPPFLSRASWSLDALGRVVFILALAWIPADQPLVVLGDDTLARQGGKSIALPVLFRLEVGAKRGGRQPSGGRAIRRRARRMPNIHARPSWSCCVRRG